MITNLLKSVATFSSKYKSASSSILANCDQLPEFQQLINNLRNVKPEHVGIKPSDLNLYFKRDRISFFKIFETNDFTVVPRALNLHDHPNMLVISKVLQGSVRCRALDLVDRTHQVKLPQALFQKSDPRVVGQKLDAVVKQDRELKNDEIVWLTPETGNLHSFTALEDSAIFDILTPDYDHNSRFCNFYREVDQKEAAKKEPNAFMKMFDQLRNDGGDQANQIPKDVPMNSGDKTTVKYILPPFDMKIDIVNYNGEPFKV